jgi:apolipoprotein N-acyltransferase
LGLGALALLGLHGVVRLSAAEIAFVPNTTIRIVQPALDQLQKWDPANKDEVLSTYFRLSTPEDGPLPPGTLLVWPESAFPFPLTQDAGVLAAIAELLPPQTGLVTGAYRLEKPNGAEPRIFNAMYTIGDDGVVLDAYDKVHLVPFGEYLPAEDTLRGLGLRQLVRHGFASGPRRRLLDTPGGLSFAPLICYEAIFSGEILPEGPRPDFLLNVSNDGWFGRTIGPYQHLHQARIRAVEEGLPLIRAANTGISAAVDPYGRILAMAGLGQTTVVESRLPAAIAQAVYARWRNAVITLLLAACFLVLVTRLLTIRAAMN